MHAGQRKGLYYHANEVFITHPSTGVMDLLEDQ